MNKEENKVKSCPNIIIITIDCLRSDHLSKECTPEIYKFSKDCYKFNNCIAVGSSTPLSFPGILKGVYPLSIIKNKDIFDQFYVKNLPEYLKLKGYFTAGIQAGIPWISSSFNYHKGFDVFSDYRRSSNISFFASFKNLMMPSTDWGTPFKQKTFMNSIRYKLRKFGFSIYSVFEHGFCNNYPYPRADEITSEVIGVIKNSPSPKFIWVHYTEPHHPYLPDDSGINVISKMVSLTFPIIIPMLTPKHLLQKLYEKEVIFVDRQISRLIKELRNGNMYDDSLIILTADHGEEFKEHGGFFHSESKLYNELIKVPLLIKLPYKKIGGVINEQVSHIDLVPTIFDLVGINEELFGKSLLPYLLTGNKIPHTPAISETIAYYNRVIAISYNGFKYIWREKGEDEFYCLDTDPCEKRNLLNTPKIKLELQKMTSILSKHLSSESHFKQKIAIKNKIQKLKRGRI